MQYTDFLGNPVNQGDMIIYPTASGSSSAEQNLARIEEIIPLIERDYMRYDGTFDPSQKQEVRADQATKPNATDYDPRIWKNGRWVRDPAKAYVIRVRRFERGAWAAKLNFLKNVERIVVVSTLTEVS